MPAAAAASALLALALALAAAPARARPEYRKLIPNGLAADEAGTGITCGALGHVGCKSGAARNQFGLDFKAAGNKWTKELCEKDSDGDGVSNGEELGDPCCLWTTSNASPKGFRTTGLSHPGEKGETVGKSATKCDAATAGSATSATSTTTAAATTTSSSGGDSKCFPADAAVQLESGATIRMDALAIGDRVLVAPGVYSPVYLFTHKLSGGAPHAFLRLRTAAGPVVSVTPGHYLPVSGRGLVAAGSVRVGDELTLASGDLSPVVAVEAAKRQGLYNPQTVQGDIVVDGVVSSTYTTAVEPAAAHAALYALRVVYNVFQLAVGGLDAGSPVEVPAVLQGQRAVL